MSAAGVGEHFGLEEGSAIWAFGCNVQLLSGEHDIGCGHAYRKAHGIVLHRHGSQHAVDLIEHALSRGEMAVNSHGVVQSRAVARKSFWPSRRRARRSRRSRSVRPATDRKVRPVVLRLAWKNESWGYRIHGEPAELGVTVARDRAGGVIHEYRLVA
jgi:hypothetical protein